MDKIKVLVIDDEKVVLMALKKILEKHGFLVDTVDSSKESLEMVAHDGYKLYFLDYILPDLDGIEVYRNLKEHSPDSKVIFISGSINTDEIIKKAKEVTPNEEITCIYKPDISEEVLLETIKKVI
jgi:two-component system, NtrC family, response regulator HydG